MLMLLLLYIIVVVVVLLLVAREIFNSRVGKTGAQLRTGTLYGCLRSCSNHKRLFV